MSRLQVYQLQQEKKKLQEDFAQLLKEREQLEERCSSYEHEKIQLGPRLEESKWEVSSRKGLGSKVLIDFIISHHSLNSHYFRLCSYYTMTFILEHRSAPP